ncbi:starch phosphorylase, glycosyltransferase family 35 protein [Pseudohyphozyma bogoriensis]|nr:starch phosphorylase, glycosyltransferase family 35 protein [Pseudohyphozyma bogoriensis]
MASNSSNPYSAYVEQLEAQVYKTPSEGFKWRLVALYILNGLAVIGAITQFTLLWIDAKRKRNESLWLFRLVQRPQGRFIVTNAKVAHCIMSVVCLAIGMGLYWELWKVYIDHGSQAMLGAWQICPALAFYTHGWLVSWGQLQAYLLTPDQINKHMLTPMVANTLFVGGGILMGAGLIASCVTLTHYSREIWDHYVVVANGLKTLENNFNGTVDIPGLFALQPEIQAISRTSQTLKTATFGVTPFIVGGILLVTVVNFGSIALTRIVRGQIKQKFEQLQKSESQWTQESIVSIPADDRRRSSAGQSGGRRESANGTGTRSRNNIRNMSRDGIGSQVAQARQIMLLQKAERDLVVISAMVGSVAFVATGLTVWSIVQQTLNRTFAWPVVEFGLLSFNWLYAGVLAITYCFFCHNQWVNLTPPASANDSKSRQNSMQTSAVMVSLQHPSSSDNDQSTEKVGGDFTGSQPSSWERKGSTSSALDPLAPAIKPAHTPITIPAGAGSRSTTPEPTSQPEEGSTRILWGNHGQNMPPPPPSPKANEPINAFFEQSSGQAKRKRLHKRSATGFLPEKGVQLKEVFPGDAEVWKDALHIASQDLQSDVPSISASIVKHITTTLAKAPFNVDDLSTYQATALSLRDRLGKKWQDTQTFYTEKNPKRVYYFSLEFLMGKSLDNALLNLGQKDEYRESVSKLGFQLEDLLDVERDAGLGNGGLGRLAACYLDSMSTTNLPAWGYGLRYQYGIFRQLLSPDGAQLEVPDPWLDHSNPWEMARLDASVEVKFYGEAIRGEGGKGPGAWTGGLDVLAVPYDLPIPGYKTDNVNNIRLYSSKPKKAFDLASFNQGDYLGSIREAEEAENITRVLYPNDNTLEGKVLRLKQQYFWTSASLADIIRRFLKLSLPWILFPDHVAIQLNDTHPTLELMRVLVDEEQQPWDTAWNIVTRTFGYTNHTVLPEALEKWPVPMVQHLLPRHMQLIFDINLNFLQEVEKKFPGDYAKMCCSHVFDRVAYLAIIGSHKVNGVAELHSGLVKEMMHDFVDFFGPDHFGNVTNGITARRWLLQCNPGLADLITSKLASDTWLTDLYRLKELVQFKDDPEFQKKWYEIKAQNKDRLATYIEKNLGITINRKGLFDCMTKRLHEYKRQTMAILAVIYRYLQLKKLSPQQRKNVVPRVSIFAGKAAPGYYIAKLTIQLINSVCKTVAADKDVSEALQVVFIPDYSVGLAEIIIPASDISEHISTAGTEASGTSNMKYCLNGGLLIGTQDGANLEIAEEVGDENVFFFGNLTPDVPALRKAHHFGEARHPPELTETINAIRSGLFGNPSVFEPLLSTISEDGDYYLVSDDFCSYLEAQKMVDQEYLDTPSWTKKSIHTVAHMGKFSSDRAILQYAEEIWNVEPLKVPPS